MQAAAHVICTLDSGYSPANARCGEGYSAIQVIDFAGESIAKAFRGIYPFEIDGAGAMVMFGSAQQFSGPEEVFSFVEPKTTELERRLTACETSRG